MRRLVLAIMWLGAFVCGAEGADMLGWALANAVKKTGAPEIARLGISGVSLILLGGCLVVLVVRQAYR